MTNTKKTGKLFLLSFLALGTISCGADDSASSEKLLDKPIEKVAELKTEDAINFVLDSDVRLKQSSKEKIAKSRDDEDKATGLRTRYVAYPEQGVILGQGWDAFANEPVGNNCIVFERRVVPGHELNINAQEIVSRYHLNKALKMSMSGSYSGYGVKASAKASYSNSLDINQNSTNILATINVWKGDEFTAPARLAFDAETQTDPGDAQYYQVGLTNEMVDFLKSKEPLANGVSRLQQFRRMCGDSYVGHIRNGASLNAFLAFDELSRTDKSSMAASISASGWGAKLNGSVAASEEQTNENKTTNISIFQTGGFLKPSPLNISDFRKTVSEFTKSSDPEYFPVKPYEIGLMSYANLANWPIDQIPTNPDSMSEMITLYWLYNDIRKDYVETLQFPERFSMTDLSKIPVGEDVTLALTDTDCVYKRDQLLTIQRIRPPEVRVSETRSKPLPYFTLLDGQPPNCPDGSELVRFLSSDVTNVRSHLDELTVIQIALRKAIDACRFGGNGFQNCTSRTSFKDLSHGVSKIFNVSENLTNFADFTNQNVSLDSALDAMAMMEIDGFQKVKSDNLVKLQEQVEATQILTASYETFFPEARPEDEPLPSTLAFFDRNEDIISKYPNLVGEDRTGVIDRKTALRVIAYEEELNAKYDGLNELFTKLDSEPQRGLTDLKSYIVSKSIAEAELPSIWPFTLFSSNDLAVKSTIEDDPADQWEKLVQSYFYYVASLPTRILSNDGVPLPQFDETPETTSSNEVAIAGQARTKALRKSKLDTLLNLSEAFCDEDILHGLCRPLDLVVEDLNTAGIATINDVTPTSGKIHRKLKCRPKKKWGITYGFKCKIRTWQDPTTYISRIISGEDIEL